VCERCGERKKKKNEERRMKSEAREREREDRERRSVREGGTVEPAPAAARVTICIAVLNLRVHDKADSQCISVLSTCNGSHLHAGSGPLLHMSHRDSETALLLAKLAFARQALRLMIPSLHL
jgi:hypothetical protein